MKAESWNSYNILLNLFTRNMELEIQERSSAQKKTVCLCQYIWTKTRAMFAHVFDISFDLFAHNAIEFLYFPDSFIAQYLNV